MPPSTWKDYEEEERLWNEEEAITMSSMQSKTLKKVLAQSSIVHVTVCGAVSGQVLGETDVPRDAFVADIKTKIACVIGLEAVLHPLFMGDGRLDDDAAQPFAFTDSDSVTISLLRQAGGPSKEEVMKVVHAVEKRRRANVSDLVYISRTCPVVCWEVLASRSTLTMKQHDIVASMLVRNGGEQEAQNALALFMKMDRPSRYGAYRGYGIYMSWLRSFQDFARLSSIICTTAIMRQAGFVVLCAVMEALDTTLKHAGNSQNVYHLDQVENRRNRPGPPTYLTACLPVENPGVKLVWPAPVVMLEPL